MEDYGSFVQHRLCRLRRSEAGHDRASPASSLIRFHGQPILPPLLSGEQREEMRRHRDAAQKPPVRRKLRDDPRMAHVQAMLHSVQLRNTPTLEELLQESETEAKSSYSQGSGGGSLQQSSYFIGSKDSLSLSPPPERKDRDGVSLPPFTSTTYSAFYASNVTPQQNDQEGCLADRHHGQQESPPRSQNAVSQTVSSGYVTYENVENTVSVSGGTDAGSHAFVSPEETHNMGVFFLHNTSNTIAKMPDIISHPPIDGEELERSGLESSFSNSFLEVQDICCSVTEDDSVTREDSLEPAESCHVDSTRGGENHPITTALDLEKDDTSDRTEGPAPSLENSGLSDNPELSRTFSPDRCPGAETHIQHEPTESTPANNRLDDAEPSEEPYRLSLQALLKKSQEYRRRQRMLRNQAKNTKIQERTPEQPRTRTEEQSLSDKENDEFPRKGAVTAEGKKTKERRGTSVPSVETAPKKSLESDGECFMKRPRLKSENTHLRGDGNTKGTSNDVEKTTFKNNQLNISQMVITEPKRVNVSSKQQHGSTGTSPGQEAPRKGTGKYRIPVPHICRSPVHCKSKGGVQDGEDADGAETSEKKVSVSVAMDEDRRVEDGHPGVGPPTADLPVEGYVASVSAKSSLHIDQLESNLCSLKVLISDLESTLTKSLGNGSQTESNAQSEPSFQGAGRPEQIKDEQSEWLLQNGRDEGQDGGGVEGDQRCEEPPGGQSLENFKNTHEATEAERSAIDALVVPLTVREEGTEEANVSELRLVKTLATERGKEKGSCKEGLTTSYGQCGGVRKQLPPTKCILSVAQRLRIPDVFRNDPSEGSAPMAPGLSDAGDHPAESRKEPAVGGRDSSQLPSLNQSYDVDSPSGLWLLEGPGSGPGSDPGATDHRVQEKHLTPDGGSEGQGGVSKVKRRLLMHVTEETWEGSAHGSGVRPDSSTPRAAVRWHGGRCGEEDEQERLRQVHAAQVRALQDEHRRQQEELLQSLAARYRLLQSVSLPCSVSSSRLGDALTFPPSSQTSGALPERYRPLLLAAVKGFLTRRLLATERVGQLARTIRDTQQLLEALSGGEFVSRQDLLLQERVALQLRAARYEVNDIFFSLSVAERMQLISWDRELARERELRRQSGQAGAPKGKSSLSAATQKSLERKRGIMIQKKAAGRHRGAVKRSGHGAGSAAERPLETKQGRLRTNPQRVPKSTYSSRPR